MEFFLRLRPRRIVEGFVPMTPELARMRRAALRALGVAIALLLVAGQLSALGHLGLVQHARCAEHGELVHAKPAHDNVLPARGAESSVTASDQEALAHEHCDYVGRVREQLGIAAARCAILADRDPTPSVIDPLASDTPTAQRAPLAIAPKQSPPS
jgi:hypothetical protein